jgi:hypothetical protein
MHLKQDAHDLHESHDNKDFTHTHTLMVRGVCMYDATVLAHMLGYCLKYKENLQSMQQQ